MKKKPPETLARRYFMSEIQAIEETADLLRHMRVIGLPPDKAREVLSRALAAMPPTTDRKIWRNSTLQFV